MGRVLVIEDEEVLRRSMVRALAKLPGVDAVGAGSLTDALASIDDQFPDLILSDLDLPDRSGIELIGEISRRGRFTPIVFISAYLEAYGSRIPPHAGVRALEKPVALEDLRALVLEQLNDTASGEPVSPFGPVDYLQLAAMGGHSVEISVTGPGERGGSIFVHRGELWHAEDAEGEGPEALARIIDPKPASTTCRTSQDAPLRRSIVGRWEELVLDAVRRADESARDDGAGPLGEPVAGATAEPGLESGVDAGEDAADFDLGAAFAPGASAEPPRADDGFGAAMERGLEALLAKDYQAARSAFLEAQGIRPEDRVVGANLQRLRDLGFGQPCEPEGEAE